MDITTLKKLPKKGEGETDRFTPLVIFSSDQGFPAFAKAHVIGYKSVMGLYQGIIEESYVINHADGAQIMEAGLLKGQKNVLLLSPQEPVYGSKREVWLATVDESGMFLDPAPSPKFIGHWHKVSVTEALHSDAWTCYPDEPAWYVAKMPKTHLKPTCGTLSQ